MTFPLFQFLTKAPEPNANAGVANGISGLEAAGNRRQFDLEQSRLKTNAANEYNLKAAEEARATEGQQFGEKKTKAALLDDYTTRLSAGDYAGAAAMAPQLKMLGIQPVLRSTPNEAPATQYEGAGPTEDTFKAQSVPPLLMKQMGGALPAQPSVPSPETPTPQGDVYDFIDTTTGEKLGTVDTGSFKAQAKEGAERMGEGFRALPLPEGFPSEEITKPAANEAEQKFAIGNAMGLVNNAMRHPHGGGRGGGAPAGKDLNRLITEVRTTQQAANTDQRVAELNKALNGIAVGLEGFKEGSPVSERQAVAQQIKQTFPGALSDQERNYIINAGGFNSALINKLNYYADSGHLDPSLIAGLRRYMEAVKKVQQDRIEQISTESVTGLMNAHPELDADTKERLTEYGIGLHSAEAARRRREAHTSERGEVVAKRKRPAVLGP